MENPSGYIRCLFSEASCALSLFTLTCTFHSAALFRLFAFRAEPQIFAYRTRKTSWKVFLFVIIKPPPTPPHLRIQVDVYTI